MDIDGDSVNNINNEQSNNNRFDYTLKKNDDDNDDVDNNNEQGIIRTKNKHIKIITKRKENAPKKIKWNTNLTRMKV